MGSKKYSIEISRAAQREFSRLDRSVQERVTPVINALASSPRPRGCVRLTGEDNTWRVRVGTWRILYTIDDDVVTVLVIGIAHRRDAYR